RALVHGEPVAQVLEFNGGGLVRLDVLFDGAAVSDDANASDDGVLVNVEARAARMKYFHGLLLDDELDEEPASSESDVRAPELRALGTGGGARRAPGPTDLRAHHCTKNEPTSVRRGCHPLALRPRTPPVSYVEGRDSSR